MQKIERVPASLIKLRATVSDGGRVTFSFEVNEKFVAIPQTFQATKGKWIGAKAGIYCIGRQAAGNSGHFDFDYVKFV